MSESWLALWNGLSPEIPEDEYECWHGIEHVPERVSREGFIEAHRYRAVSPDTARYFTWYRLRSLSALDSPGYRELLDHPTPWSARMRPHLIDFLRWPCEAEAAFGPSVGAALATWRLSVASAAAPGTAGADAADGADTPLARWLSDAVRRGVLLSARIGRHQPDTRFHMPGVQPVHAPAVRGECLVLLHHVTQAALDAGLAALEAARPANIQPIAPPGRYQWLMATRADALATRTDALSTGTDALATSAGARPAPRLDLMRGFKA